MEILHKLTKFIRKDVITPTSVDKDDSRREYILNILLLGLITLSAIAFLSNLLVPLFIPVTDNGSGPMATGGVLIFFIGLLILSKKAEYHISAFIFLLLMQSILLYVAYAFGADLPILLLFLTLTIIISGILIGSKTAFFLTIINSLIIFLFTHLQIVGALHPDTTWKSQVIHMSDSVASVIILGLIAIIAWLYNQEMEHALKRAQKSEIALKKQRDELELIVEERTQELKKAQVEKLMQLYRFAEFGRLSSGLFHELATPLNLVSMNLGRLRGKNSKIQSADEIKQTLGRAHLGAKRLEKFLEAARKQIQNQEIQKIFSINKEINHAIEVLNHKAKTAHVVINFREPKNIEIFGNPVKFNQVITNLLANSIESYDSLPTKNRVVEVEAKKVKKKIIISIQDWGCGIEDDVALKIFDPLFTTKSFEKGTGIGLSLCKTIIENDFKGKIIVKSIPGTGSTFATIIPE